jgi:hypothetical protein
MDVTRKTAMIAALALSLPVPLASAQGVDPNKPILCAVAHVSSCEESGDCQGGTPASINLPRFLHVDVAGKQISATRPDGSERVTPISASQQVGDRLLLQGVDEGPLSWSLNIEQDNGDMTLAGIKGDTGFIVFGGCMTQ